VTRAIPLRELGAARLTPDEARALSACPTLADVLAFGRALVPARAPSEIVTQDEYTHDVVLPLDAHRWLVFDTT
jgi:hypothetical protein